MTDARKPDARAVAWMRGVCSPSTPNGPAEYDAEFAYGDDQPDGEGWLPLYREAPDARAGASSWLEKLQWNGTGNFGNQLGYCLCCGRHRVHGHATDCDLNSHLRGAQCDAPDAETADMSNGAPTATQKRRLGAGAADIRPGLERAIICIEGLSRNGRSMPSDFVSDLRAEILKHAGRVEGDAHPSPVEDEPYSKTWAGHIEMAAARHVLNNATVPPGENSAPQPAVSDAAVEAAARVLYKRTNSHFAWLDAENEARAVLEAANLAAVSRVGVLEAENTRMRAALSLAANRIDRLSLEPDDLRLRAEAADWFGEAINALSQQPSPAEADHAIFAFGDRVEKHKGSYRATGEVRGLILTKAGAWRYAVEYDQPAGLLHIHGPGDIRALNQEAGIIASSERADKALEAAAARIMRLEAENAKLHRLAEFVAMWCDRGPPHAGPGREAVALDAIRHHPTLKQFRAFNPEGRDDGE